MPPPSVVRKKKKFVPAPRTRYWITGRPGMVELKLNDTSFIKLAGSTNAEVLNDKSCLRVKPKKKDKTRKPFVPLRRIPAKRRDVVKRCGYNMVIIDSEAEVSWRNVSIGDTPSHYYDHGAASKH